MESLVAKHMTEIAGSMSIPRDKVSYLLSGGIMKRNLFGTQMKCSVTSIGIESIGNDLNESFQWKNIEAGYKSNEKAVVYLPDKSRHQKITAGLELVALSRVTSPEDLAIVNVSSSLCISKLKNWYL